MSPRESAERAFSEPPSPGRNGTLDDLVQGLRLLKAWAGNPSYDVIKDRINAAWATAGRPGNESAKKATVADCFKPGRRRLNSDLVIAVVRALHPDMGYVAEWRQALRAVNGETVAAAQVRVQDTLPQDLPAFTGREHALDQIRQALSACSRDHAAVVIITGMAGIGKTRLAVHAGHLFAPDGSFDRVLFVDLRGFHSDPTRPPADPAAVLDGFLRLLGVPGQQIPHDLAARSAAYRRRLAGTRALVVLDNAADAEQVRPLLPETPHCPVLVTSRRGLPVAGATRVALDVFTREEALAFLETAPQVPIGQDPEAAARIARRCGHLPLALGLVTGHIWAKPGWTLTDHAERLDERRHQGRLDTVVEVAFDLSYRHLPAGEQRLLRLAALHPGQDFDTHAAAALAGTDVPDAEACLRDLCRDHLLQRSAPGRYAMHDLVRAYATSQSTDEDPPPERRAALTRLFDFYLATIAAAMDSAYPAEVHRRPRVPPTVTTLPVLTGPDTAHAWLDTERPTLVAVAEHTSTHGWPAHATLLSASLFRYLNGGYPADGLAVHGHAVRAARQTSDPAGYAHAVTNLGVVHLSLGRYATASGHFQKALHLFQGADDPAGQARVQANLGVVEERLGRYRSAAERYRRALALQRRIGDRIGEACTLSNLGIVEERLGRYRTAADRYQRAFALCRETGDRNGEADTLNCIGNIEGRLGQHRLAAGHLRRAVILHRRLGNRPGEAAALDSLGLLHIRLGQPDRAAARYRKALAIVREVDDPQGEASALNGLGEAARSAGRPGEAVTHHAAALAAAVGDRDQQARAHVGLGHAHRALADADRARPHYQRALALYTELGMPEADQIRTHLTAIDADLAGAGHLPRDQCLPTSHDRSPSCVHIAGLSDS